MALSRDQRADQSAATLALPAWSTAIDRKWVREFLDFYWNIGFFRGHAGKSKADWLAELWEPWESGDSDSYDANRPADPLLLAQDENRVWNEDCEAGAEAGANVYVNEMARWAGIARGAFEPEDVREEWPGPTSEGPLRLHFKLGDKPHVVEVAAGEWLDLGLFKKLNAIIGPGGSHFADFPTDGQDAYLVVLTTAERDLIEKNRGLRFEFIE